MLEAKVFSVLISVPNSNSGKAGTNPAQVCFQKVLLANYGHKFHLTLLVMMELAIIVAFGKCTPENVE